jgi:hypothetical protein
MLTWAVWWLFPPIEMFDEGGVPRARRFRTWIVGVGGALVLVFVGWALDRLTS